MSTIKSSSEDLTLNADGSNEVKFQINAVEKASINSSGLFTSTTIDATALTGNLPAISGASLTSLPASYTTTLVRAYPSATTSVPTTTFTQIPFNTESYDVDGDYNTGTYRFVAPTTGYYLAVFEGHFTTQTDGAFIELIFRKNGSAYSTTYRHAGNTTNSGSNNVDIIYMTSSQYLECWAYQTSGSTHTFQNGQQTNWFSICRVG